jgi:tRNA nucleotidyltransferase/poly(A) polymerase
LSAPWLTDRDSRAVMDAMAAGGAEALYVGGCVRNTLLREPVRDIDIATSAEPQETIRLIEAAGLRAVPTGADHGTITAVAGGKGFEITTYRRDIDTDGRRATVAFSTDVAEDAARRDFTMNALYAKADGTLVDPLGGLADLEARRVRFIGHAEDRIREDYLRILRFFRFHAWYGRDGFDPDGLAACATLAEGLEGLSRERVGTELKRLLAAPDPAPALAAMAKSGVLIHVAPGADAGALAPLVHAEGLAGVEPDPIRRLACIDAEELVDRLRLSRIEERRLAAIRAALAEGEPPAHAAYRHGAEVATDAALIRAATLSSPPQADLAGEITRGAAARFPVAAGDLIARGMPPGPGLGAALKRLEARWVASDFRLDKTALLARAN